MNLPGERIKLVRWIHSRDCVVRVVVEAVVLADDPSEPCLEPTTLKWLDEVQRLADAEDTAALAKVGEIYVRKSA